MSFSDSAILWLDNDFSITRQMHGITPEYSNDPKKAAKQRENFHKVAATVSELNHLLHILGPNMLSRFRDFVMGVQMTDRATSRFEFEVARCIAQAMTGNPVSANESLGILNLRLGAKISNRGRTVHLAINVALTILAVAGGVLLAKSSIQPILGFNKNELAIAVIMGAIGALFSTTVRLRSMQIDPSVARTMHWVYGFQRVLVGILGAVIIYIGLRSGILNNLFQLSTADAVIQIGADMPISNVFWLSFICVLAGFSERFVPNILDSEVERTIRRQKELDDES